VTVLCGELLREAEFLVNQRVHPMTIVQGWRLAVQIARSALEQAAVDNSADQARFKEDLMNIARTTLSSKLLNVEKDHFAGLAVEAVLRLKGSGNLDYIQVRLLGSVTCGTVKYVNFFVVFACGRITCVCPLSGMWHAVEFRCITASAFHAQVSVLTCGSPACYVSQVIKKPGESLADSFLEEGFVLDKVNYSWHELACALKCRCTRPNHCARHTGHVIVIIVLLAVNVLLQHHFLACLSNLV
jgi:hypothetical protein